MNGIERAVLDVFAPEDGVCLNFAEIYKEVKRECTPLDVECPISEVARLLRLFVLLGLLERDQPLVTWSGTAALKRVVQGE